MTKDFIFDSHNNNMAYLNSAFAALANECAKAQTEQFMLQAISQQHGNRAALHDITERCADLSATFSQTGMEKCPLKKRALIITDAIIKAADGNILCECYNGKDKTEQRIHVYDGMYWCLVEGQTYVSFCKAATEHCNIDESFRHDPDFMKLIFDRLAFIISKELPPVNRNNEVWINLMNGTLTIDLEGNIQLRDHRREDYFFHVLPYCYDPSAECHLFLRFLDRVIPEREAQMLLAEYIAQCFIKGYGNIQKMLILFGDGSNGKSVLLDVIKALMGGENVSELSLSGLTRNDNERVHIEHKLLNISHESAGDIDYSVLKLMVSGDPLTAKYLYRNAYIIKDYAKLITSFNELPRPEQTHGFFRRCIILPMTVTITEEERDVNLARKIIAEELPGILNWVLEGMKRFLTNGYQLTKSPMCEAALDAYKANSNSVISFFNECCVPCDDYEQKGKDIYDAYKSFCYEEKLNYLGQKKFYEEFGKLKTNPHESHHTRMFSVKYKDRN